MTYHVTSQPITSKGVATRGRRLFDVESLASAIEQAAVCRECKEGSLVLRERPLVDYQSWKASHICHNNHEGSSNSMEKQGTVDIYSRSIDLFSFAVTWSTLGKQNIQDGGR